METFSLNFRRKSELIIVQRSLIEEGDERWDGQWASLVFFLKINCRIHVTSPFNLPELMRSQSSQGGTTLFVDCNTSRVYVIDVG